VKNTDFWFQTSNASIYKEKIMDEAAQINKTRTLLLHKGISFSRIKESLSA